jgi:hypothetical protein
MQFEALKYLYDMEQACVLLSSFLVGKTFADYEADPDRLNPPQATQLQPVVRRVSPVGLQPVPLSRLAGVVKRVMIFVNDP